MKRKILFIFFFVAFVGIGGAVFTDNSVSSQANPLLNGYGRACTNNYPECPGGYKNLVQSVLREEINLYGMSQDDLFESIESGYDITGDELNKLCIREELIDIIPRLGFPRNNLPTYHGDAAPVACPGGWQPQQGFLTSEIIDLPVIGGIGGSTDAPWGCCPTGFQFVNQGRDIINIEAVQQGLCCRIDHGKPGIGTPYEAKLSGINPGCYDRDDNLIYSIGDQYRLSFLLSNAGIAGSLLTEQQIYSTLENSNESNIIAGVVGLPESATLSPYISVGYDRNEVDFPITDNYGLTPNPQLGVSLAPHFSSSNVANRSRILTEANKNLPGLSCPNTGCSVFNFSGITGYESDLGTPILEPGSSENGDFLVGKTEEIIDFAAENNVTPACTRCYNTGEAIAIEGENVLICNPANASGGYVDKRPLVNGNIRDTLAVYTSQPGVNLENSIRCIEQGGIYTAIGCIDPTPIGILTGLIRIALGVVGGVALIQLILAGLAYQSGNEENIQKARARIFATIGGLAFLIFSVLILRIIGVNVLDVVPADLF